MRVVVVGGGCGSGWLIWWNASDHCLNVIDVWKVHSRITSSHHALHTSLLHTQLHLHYRMMSLLLWRHALSHHVHRETHRQTEKAITSLSTNVHVRLGGDNRWYNIESTPCPVKKHPRHLRCNLKDYQFLIIFDTDISDTTIDQMTVQFSTAPIVCFCTTWGNKTNKILHFIIFRLLRFSQVLQKQTFGEVGIRMITWCQIVSKMFVPKIIKICQSFFKSQLIMLGMPFDAFLFISTHISFVLVSSGSAEADIGWSEILMASLTLMASCARNNPAKNY